MHFTVHDPFAHFQGGIAPPCLGGAQDYICLSSVRSKQWVAVVIFVYWRRIIICWLFVYLLTLNGWSLWNFSVGLRACDQLKYKRYYLFVVNTMFICRIPLSTTHSQSFKNSTKLGWVEFLQILLIQTLCGIFERFGERVVIEYTAVSYTHLTLPTILRV